jgi:ribosomal protein S18 acetylase RimI-like enzyme
MLYQNMNRTRMILRRYQDSDFQHMITLHRLVLKKEDAYRGDGVWENDLRNIAEQYFHNGGEFLVGLENDSIIAMGALKKIDSTIAEIARMRVHPDYQGKGLGNSLLQELERIAVQKKYKTLVLETDARLTAAIHLYKKNGYTFWKEEFIEGHNCLWYKKKFHKGHNL